MKVFSLAGFLLLITSVACGAETLQVGVASTEITPPVGYSMSGYFRERGATGTLDPLLAKAIVWKQGERRAGMLIADILKVDRPLADAVRNRVAEKSDLPADHLIVAATHTHTGPDYRTDLARYRVSQASSESDAEHSDYIPLLIDRMAEALINAEKNLHPTTIRAGSGQEGRVSFNRRFILEDGTVRTWAKLSQEDVVKAAGPIDPEIGLISFSAPDDDAPSAAIVNFALHCDTVGGTKFSADFPGHIARVLGKEFGAGFDSIFATGACGDINHADPTGAPRRSAAEIGEMIADSAIAAWPKLEATEANLGFASRTLEIPLQPCSEKDLAEARKIIEASRAGERFPTVRLAWANKKRKLHQLRTGKIVTSRGSEQTLPAPEGPRDHLPVEVQAVRLSDDTALVSLPGEIFVALGLDIKNNSPFENTFVVELANAAPGYVPTKEGFERGGYEAINSIYAPGSGERLVETAGTLLEDLKN